MSDTAKTKFELRHEALVETLNQRFAGQGCEASLALGEVTMVVPKEKLVEVAVQLRDEDAFLFKTPIDVCGMDYAGYGDSEWVTDEASSTGFNRGVNRVPVMADSQGDQDRFAVVYHLLSVANNQRLRLRVFVDTEQPIVDSVMDVWHGVDWFEREAFDLYGIMFSGHYDLRRILTDYGFVGHPFRKDFPLEGYVQMRYDPEAGRVVYEPTDLEQRILVPRVIREDDAPLTADAEQQGTTDA